MKHVAIAVSLVFSSLVSAAEVPYVCDDPSYAKAFRAGYERSLAARKALGRSSEDETAARMARVREAIATSGLVDTMSVAAFIDSTLLEPDMAQLLRAGKDAVAHIDASVAALTVAAEKTGSDAADSDKMFCQNGSANFSGLAQKRRASEDLGEAVRQRLAEFGRIRGVSYSDDIESALLPIRWSCNSVDGFTAAEEGFDLALRLTRLTLNKLQSAFEANVKAHASAKDWSYSRTIEILRAIAQHPHFVALENRKRLMIREVQGLVQARLEGKLPRESAAPCRWSENVPAQLHEISDLTRRQFDYIAEVLPNVN
ncbi:hypothetical protein [Rhizobacter sp. Root1221]|uniref:hypothetical protein n=1 Tax=Rhizobacter sp. Root1221 TaxID=1736433 RepID=UPI0012FC6B77|nr:hypothetical protein [Rhizobacter sp. Root1221]